MVTSFIGPSGCGKSTFLRCINRMNDTIDVCRVTGDIMIDTEDIYDRRVDPVQLRAKVGMVFQKPNPFPKSIYDNVAYGPKIHGMARNKTALDEIVEKSLRRAALWDEAKDRLQEPGTGLSGGQQQRLAIARALAMEPKCMLFDEATSALDPELVGEVLDTIRLLADEGMTMICVTHEMGFAREVSDRVAFFHEGKIEEINQAEKLFGSPKSKYLQKFLSKVKT